MTEQRELFSSNGLPTSHDLQTPTPTRLCEFGQQVIDLQVPCEHVQPECKPLSSHSPLREEPDDHASLVAIEMVHGKPITDFLGDGQYCPESQPVVLSHRDPDPIVLFSQTPRRLLDV
jgi:hypothetical protein